MKFLLFLVLILVCIFFLINYYNNQHQLLMHQIIVLQRQNSILKNDLSKYKSCKNISIEFITPSNATGILESKAKIFLSPIEDSTLINCCTKTSDVKILDACIFNNINWYYVCLPLDNNINCHGWVKEINFTDPCEEISDVE